MVVGSTFDTVYVLVVFWQTVVFPTNTGVMGTAAFASHANEVNITNSKKIREGRILRSCVLIRLFVELNCTLSDL